MRNSLQMGLVILATLIAGITTLNSAMAVSPQADDMKGVAQALPAGRSETITRAFDQQEVDQSKFIAVAVPLAIGHKLIILEQISDAKQCWRETGTDPVIVDPLLLKFDFSRICGRSTDSNHYSIHQAGQDLALYYGLKVEQRQGELVLLGSPYPGHQGQEIEIGRTRGISPEVMKISLDPGWRFTKRAFNGQKLDHVYLAHGGELLPIATPTPTTMPSDDTQLLEDTQPSADGEDEQLLEGDQPLVDEQPSTDGGELQDDTQPLEDTQPSTGEEELQDDTQPTSSDGDESSSNDQRTSGNGKSSQSLIERILRPVQQILPFLIPLL